jgi:hypothetical protein
MQKSDKCDVLIMVGFVTLLPAATSQISATLIIRDTFLCVTYECMIMMNKIPKFTCGTVFSTRTLADVTGSAYYL